MPLPLPMYTSQSGYQQLVLCMRGRFLYPVTQASSLRMLATSVPADAPRKAKGKNRAKIGERWGAGAEGKGAKAGFPKESRYSWCKDGERPVMD